MDIHTIIEIRKIVENMAIGCSASTPEGIAEIDTLYEVHKMLGEMVNKADKELSEAHEKGEL